MFKFTNLKPSTLMLQRVAPTYLRVAAFLFAGVAVWFSVLMSTGHAADTPAATSVKPWHQLGRTPTAAEIKAWDIDVTPDFKGLPAGSGTVDQGIDIWEAKCASCHGVFGESNEVFTPLIGGTTQQDMESGHVAGLASGSHPYRTTMMRLSQISTLWDYINRAMPWNAPKSLTADEVYAVIAYMLNTADVVDDDFEFSNENIAEVQAKLPNRNGMKKFEPLWRVDGKADVQGDACMTNCEASATVNSSIPDYARNDHGNLAEQNRLIGFVRGTDTTRPAPATLAESKQMAHSVNSVPVTAQPSSPASAESSPARVLAQSSGCLACHGVDKAIVGPALTDVAKRYRDEKSAIADLSDKVRNGASGTWGAIPMPANPHIDQAQAESLIKWILTL
ncbi:MAG: c-type cytochrome [Burkholderiaceae bacterium]